MMKILLPKSYVYSFLFLVCIGVTYLDNFELTFAVWSVTFLISFNGSYSISLLKQICCLIAIFLIALTDAFFNDYKGYFIFRDATYMFKPIIGLLVGYQLCRHLDAKTFRVIAGTGVIIAALHLIIIVHAILFLHASNMNDIRLRAGYFSDFEVYALIILIFHDKFELGFSRQNLRYFTMIVGFSSFMYLARTNFIQFAILFIAMKGLFKINRTSVTIIGALIAVTAIGYSAIVYSNPKRNGPGIEGLLYKIKIAPIEAFKTKINAGDWKDFNDNYRSFENISTIRQVTGKGKVATLFGEGLGSQIDLKQEVWLGDMFLRYISILHNGFMTVFLKSGLLGILIYLYSIFLLFRHNRSNIAIITNINLLLVGTAVFLIFSNWVFMGLYNKSDNKSILIGLLFCYRAMMPAKYLLPRTSHKETSDE